MSGICNKSAQTTLSSRDRIMQHCINLATRGERTVFTAPSDAARRFAELKAFMQEHEISPYEIIDYCCRLRIRVPISLLNPDYR
jgi:hypothetical protein